MPRAVAIVDFCATKVTIAKVFKIFVRLNVGKISIFGFKKWLGWTDGAHGEPQPVFKSML